MRCARRRRSISVVFTGAHSAMWTKISTILRITSICWKVSWNPTRHHFSNSLSNTWWKKCISGWKRSAASSNLCGSMWRTASIVRSSSLRKMPVLVMPLFWMHSNSMRKSSNIMRISAEVSWSLRSSRRRTARPPSRSSMSGRSICSKLCL